MKAEFTSNPDKDHLLITPETREEEVFLRLWNGCVISADFTSVVTSTGEEPGLHLCREI